MPLYEVSIEPLDPLLFGDNRSARAGVDHVQLDQDPSPLTLHGAIGNYLVARHRAERRRAGRPDEPWPEGLLGARQKDILDRRDREKVAELLGYCARGAGGRLWFPAPRHLRCSARRRRGEAEATVVPRDLLSPRKLESGRRTGTGWERLLLPANGEALDDEAEGEVLLSEGALGEVLCGERPRADTTLPATLARPEPRPGIGVDNDSGTVVEGQFFTRPYRRFEPAELDAGAQARPAGFVAWFLTLAPLKLDLSDAIGFIGGDRRRARFELAEAGPLALDRLCDQVAAAAATESSGFLLSLLTPLLAPDGTAPEVDGRHPIAAALGKPLHASGWDVDENHPRPLHALVPAGSVFFFKWPEDAPLGPARAELVRRLWLHPLREEGAAAGFGRCLPGIWR